MSLFHRWRLGGRIGSLLGVLFAVYLNGGWQIIDGWSVLTVSLCMLIGGEIGRLFHHYLANVEK